MTSFNLVTFSASDRFKQQVSANITLDLSSVRIGGSNLEISEGTAGRLDINGVVLEGVATPVAGTDAANKSYVDGVAQGLDVKESVKAISETNLSVTASGSGPGKTLTATANGVLTLDGVTTWTDIDNDGAVNDPYPTAGTKASRVLIAGQTAADDNGIYAVKEKGDGSTAFILERAIDADTNAEVTAGMFTFVTEGTSNADTGWVLTSDDPVTIDVSDQTFAQFSGGGAFSGGDGINISGTVIEVDLSAASGLEFSSGQLQVDLEAAGAGTGGLELNGNEIRVNVGTGLELLAGGVTVDLEAPGAGAGGLEFNGNEIRVDVGTGLELAAGGVTVDLEAAGAGTGGLEFNGNEIRVDAGDGIVLDSDGVNVDLLTNGGLQLSASDGTGQLSVDLEAAGAGTGGLELNGNEIRVDAGPGIELTATGVGVDLAANGAGTGGLQITSGEVEVDAGDGIVLDSDGVNIDLATNSGLELTASDGTGELQVDLAAAGAGTGGLVLTGNEIEVNPGDAIQLTASGVAVDFSESMTNDNAGAITVRQVVYIKANGNVDLAKNDVTDLDTFELGIVEDA